MEYFLKSLFVFFVLLYWFAEGVTEGFTWATKDKGARRRQNVLVTMHTGDGGQGIWGYHVWRMFGESLGIFAAIMTAYLLGRQMAFGSLLEMFLGTWFVGYFIYERTISYVVRGSVFAKRDKYILVGLEIERSLVFDGIIFILGIGLIISGALGA